jgi:hypothetical protein
VPALLPASGCDEVAGTDAGSLVAATSVLHRSAPDRLEDARSVGVRSVLSRPERSEASLEIASVTA